MARILLTGASGTLGRELATALLADGHDVAGLSRRPRGGAVGRDGRDAVAGDAVAGDAVAGDTAAQGTGISWRVGDLATGEGIAKAAADRDIVVHSATHPLRTRDTDVEGLRRLLAASPRAWFVYPSIVGIDRIPFFYYVHKLAAERLLESSGVRHTIVRLTQFHEFADRFAAMPVPVLPRGMRVQSISARDAAGVVARAVREGRTGRLPDVGGPEVHDLAALVRERRRAAGRRAFVLRVPFKGWRQFAQGLNLAPEGRVGTETWRVYTARVPPPA